MLIAEPGPADPDDVRETARQAAASGTVVAVGTAYASDQTWRAALPAWRQQLPEAQILDAVLTIAAPPTGPADLVSALVDQLAVVRPIVGALDDLQLARHGASPYLVTSSPGERAPSASRSQGCCRIWVPPA